MVRSSWELVASSIEASARRTPNARRRCSPRSVLSRTFRVMPKIHALASPWSRGVSSQRREATRNASATHPRRSRHGNAAKRTAGDPGIRSRTVPERRSPDQGTAKNHSYLYMSATGPSVSQDLKDSAEVIPIRCGESSRNETLGAAAATDPVNHPKNPAIFNKIHSTRPKRSKPSEASGAGPLKTWLKTHVPANPPR